MTRQPNNINSNLRFYNHKRRHKRNRIKSYSHNRGSLPLTEEQRAQIRDEGYGRLYIQKQIRRKTPMIFELYNETITDARIIRLMKYFLTLLINREKRNIDKLNIKYCFKQSDVSKIRPFIEYNESIRNKNLLPIVDKDERFCVDIDSIAKCYKGNIPVMISLRGGEIISGTIDWYSKYTVKIRLPSNRSVITYLHAYYDLQVRT